MIYLVKSDTVRVPLDDGFKTIMNTENAENLSSKNFENRENIDDFYHILPYPAARIEPLSPRRACGTT